MSEKEVKRRKVISAVCKEAWKLKKRTVLFSYSIGTALRLSWNTVRSYLRFIHTKVRGASFGNRQKLLERLRRYNYQDVILTFVREPDNPIDSCAIQVWASVKNKGSGCIGYLTRDLAYKVAPFLDVNRTAVVLLEGITGGGNSYYGCNFKFIII